MEATPQNPAFAKLALFFAGFRPLHYDKGEAILRADEEPQGVFYLNRGFARLYSISSEGEELTLIIFKPEDFFPVIWAINGSQNTYYLEALTPVEVHRAPRGEFLQFVRQNADVMFEILSRTLVRLGGLLTRAEYLVFGDAYNKTASIILICAERFGLPARAGEPAQVGKKEQQGIVIQVPLTHKDIANLVGVTRETASVEIKKLERAGLISSRGRHIIVNDSEKLRKESLLNT